MCEVIQADGTGSSSIADRIPKILSTSIRFCEVGRDAHRAELQSNTINQTLVTGLKRMMSHHQVKEYQP